MSSSGEKTQEKDELEQKCESDSKDDGDDGDERGSSSRTPSENSLDTEEEDTNNTNINHEEEHAFPTQRGRTQRSSSLLRPSMSAREKYDFIQSSREFVVSGSDIDDSSADGDKDNEEKEHSNDEETTSQGNNSDHQSNAHPVPAKVPGAVAVPGVMLDTTESVTEDPRDVEEGVHGHYHPHLIEAQIVLEGDGSHSVPAAPEQAQRFNYSNYDNNNSSSTTMLMDVVEAIPAPHQPPKWRLFATRLLVVALLATVTVVVVLFMTVWDGSGGSSSGGGSDIGTPTTTSASNETTTSTSTTLQQLQVGNTLIGSAAGDRFGAPLALSADGTLLAVAARENGYVGEDSGLVRVFAFVSVSTNNNDNSEPKQQGSWQQTGNALVGLAAGDEFGHSGLAMNANGTRLAIGALYSTATKSTSSGAVALPGAGHVRIFERVDVDSSGTGNSNNNNANNANENGDETTNKTTTTTWKQLGPSLDGLAADDQFGRAVALSEDGSIVAASAYNNHNASGHVRVFRQKTTTTFVPAEGNTNDETTPTTTTATAWEQLGSTILGKAAFDRLGRSVALSANGMRLAAGATQFGGDGPGYVQVFDYNAESNEWTQVGQDVWGNHDGDQLGRDVALSDDGTILACGANMAGDNGESSGLVRVYQLVVVDENSYGSFSWQRLGETFLGAVEGDGLGLTVALSRNGSRIAMGANQKKTGNGYVRVFDLDEDDGKWKQVKKDIFEGSALKDKFGSSVQLSADGNILAVGTIGSDANGDDSGQVQVFDLQNP